MPRITVSADLRAQIRELDQCRCAYCHTPEALAVTPFEIDHILPQSAGGETIVDNLCLACPACNRYKGATLHVLVPDTRQRVPLYHPRRQIWSAHFFWSDDWTVLMSRTPIGSATIQALRINRSQMIRLRGVWKKAGLLHLL